MIITALVIMASIATEIITIVIIYLIVVRPLKKDISKLKKQRRMWQKEWFKVVNSVEVMIKYIIPPDGKR